MNYNPINLPLKSIFSIILLIFTSHCLLAGWVITEERTDYYGNKAVQTTFIQDNLIRHETQKSIAIIDLDKKLITIVFSQYKLYWKGTTQELKESTLDAYESQMERLRVGLNESARIEFDSIFNNLKNQLLDTTSRFPDLSVEVLQTEEEEEIMGYRCKKYNVLIDSVLTESIWHTNEIKPYNDINLKNMISFMNQLTPNSGKGSLNQTNEYLDLMKSGVMLKSIEYAGNDTAYEVKVTKLREIGIIRDFFEPPPSYRAASFTDILNLMPVRKTDYDEW